jgi:transposase
VLKVEEWVAIRELAKRRVSVSEIARRTSHDRKTIRQVLGSKQPRPHGNKGKQREGKLAPYREYLLQRIEQGCLNGQVLLDEITKQGYTGKISILSHFLTPIRKELARKQEASVRFETAPGKQAQVDWASFGKVFDPLEKRWKKLYGFVFTLGYSRALCLEFTTCCDLEHFLECHHQAFAALGIPETILYDNLKTAILGRHPDGMPILPPRFHEFALFYGLSPRFCKPYRARTKGKVERSIGYVRENFWVRVSHEVAAGTLDLLGLNERAREWAREVANQRVHGTHGEVVAKRLAEELPRLGKLAGRPRFDTDYHSIRRIGRDGRLSYRGLVYQLGLAEALSEVEVTESLEGAITLRTKSGREIVAEPIGTGRPIFRLLDQPRQSADGTADGTTAETEDGLGRVESGDGAALLRLLRGASPEVEIRDLSVYEEVACVGIG